MARRLGAGDVAAGGFPKGEVSPFGSHPSARIGSCAARECVDRIEHRVGSDDQPGLGSIVRVDVWLATTTYLANGNDLRRFGAARLSGNPRRRG